MAKTLILATNSQIEDYLISKEIFPSGTHLIVEDLRAIKESVEGFVNSIYRIRGDNGHSVVMKQVTDLPLSRTDDDETGKSDDHLKEWTLDPGRMRSEISVLIFWNSIYPNICPEIYLFDEQNGVIIMEDLSDLSLLRFEFTRMKKYTHIGSRLGKFFARNLFFSSDLYLTDYRRQSLLTFFDNPEYTALERFLYEDCSIVSDHRSMPTQTWPLRQSIIQNNNIQAEINRIHHLFITDKECLIHTDLHASNLMVDSTHVKIIDTEFAGFGPIAQDFGRLTASFCLNYLSWYGEDNQYTPEQRRSYQDYLIKTIEELYDVFENEFIQLCEDNKQNSYRLRQLDVHNYLQQHFIDTMSFTALNAASRIADRGLCHDLSRLAVSERVYPQQLILSLCRDLLLQSTPFMCIRDLTDNLQSLADCHPKDSF